MYSFAQKSLSVLLLASLLRGMAHLGLLVGVSAQMPFAESNPLLWFQNSADANWDDLLDALAEQKKDEKEESEDKSKEKEGSEKEEIARKEGSSNRKKCPCHLPAFFGDHTLPSEIIIKSCQHDCEVALHLLKTRYIAHHADFSQQLYLRNHRLKIPCPAFV